MFWLHGGLSDAVFPFDKLDVIKHSVESLWNIRNDRAMMALAMTMSDKPPLQPVLQPGMQRQIQCLQEQGKAK